MRSGLACGVAVLALLVAGQASAATLYFKAHLSGGGEAPANASAGQGELTARVDTDTKVLRYKVVYDGLSGPAVAAHFHGPARSGEDAPPVVMVSDPSSPISGEAVLTAAQLGELRKGLWYFNLHTAANPGGEIRGQVTQDHPRQADAAPSSDQPAFPIEEQRGPASISAR